jgi:hypothetical protein
LALLPQPAPDRYLIRCLQQAEGSGPPENDTRPTYCFFHGQTSTPLQAIWNVIVRISEKSQIFYMPGEVFPAR